MDKYNVVEKIVTFSHSSQFNNILDVCCGNGAFAKLLLRNGISYNNLYLSDQNLNYLQLCSYFKNVKNVKFVPCDASALPFPDNHIDLIVMGNAIHHIEKVSSVMLELNRVLRKNGYIAFVEECADESFPTFKKFHDLIAYMDTYNGIFHHSTYHTEDLLKELSKYFYIQYCKQFQSQRDHADCLKYAHILRNRLLDSKLQDNIQFYQNAYNTYNELVYASNISIMFTIFLGQKLPSMSTV